VQSNRLKLNWPGRRPQQPSRAYGCQDACTYVGRRPNPTLSTPVTLQYKGHSQRNDHPASMTCLHGAQNICKTAIIAPPPLLLLLQLLQLFCSQRSAASSNNLWCQPSLRCTCIDRRFTLGIFKLSRCNSAGIGR